MFELFGIKINKTAIKILLISLSAALGAVGYSVFAWLCGFESAELLIKIGIRIAVIGIITAVTYDLINRENE